MSRSAGRGAGSRPRPVVERGHRVVLVPAAAAFPEDSVALEMRARGDGELLGTVELSRIARGNFQSAYLGYRIETRHRGRGYMTEPLQLVLRHAFRTLRLHRVEANVEPGNEASIALVRRAGFIREGFSRRYLRLGGRWRDHERWALLREDWRPSRVRSVPSRRVG